MPSFNQLTIIGNCSRDVEIRNVAGDKKVASWGMAVNHKWRTQAGEVREDVMFIDCEAWGKLTEVAGKYLAKGNPVFLTGRLIYQTWEDKNGGGKRHKHFLSVEKIQLLGSPPQGQKRSEPRQASGRTLPPQRQAPSSARPVKDDVESPIADEEVFSADDVPF